MTLPLRLTAKRKYKKQYVEKKKTPSGEVRVYDEKHIKKRWQEKVNKIKKIEKDISKLRKKYKDDLTDDNDPKTRAMAALVGLIDNTAMRVGNEASAEEMGTFGATTLLKEHATVSGNKIRFRFKGKKGVKQDVTLDDAAVASEIKKLLNGKKAKDLIFEYEEGKQIRPKVVNRYLSDFGITAKDIRGFHANRLMKEKLKKTKDFDKALEFVADEVGHEAKTLMNQYLDPALVKKHKKEASLITNAERDLSAAEKIIEEIFSMADPSAFHVAPVVPALSKTHKHKKQTVTSPYGERKDPFTGKTRFHSGTDLRARVGTPVLAFDDGKVVRVDYNDRSGNFIVIKHDNDMYSSYLHLSETMVDEDARVSREQPIGLSGNTGRSDAPHLHFSLKYKGKNIDPGLYLDSHRVVGG